MTALSLDSTSHKVLRLLIAVPSVGLALLAALAAPRGSLVGAAVLIVLTPFVVLDPGSRLAALLLALHGVNWLSSTDFPTQAREWALTVAAAVALLVIHLATALAAALPPSAPLPRPTIIRWVRRGLTVLGLSVPVWALLISQTVASPPGVPFLTYAAVASLAILALAFWMVQARSRPATSASTAPDQNRR